MEDIGNTFSSTPSDEYYYYPKESLDVRLAIKESIINFEDDFWMIHFLKEVRKYGIYKSTPNNALQVESFQSERNIFFLKRIIWIQKKTHGVTNLSFVDNYFKNKLEMCNMIFRNIHTLYPDKHNSRVWYLI